jgi:hypothetical protein
MTIVSKDSFFLTLQNALERMAFVLADESDEVPSEVLARTGHQAVIDLQGEERTSWLLVAATDGFVRELASGMMGLEPTEVDPKEHGEPTVAELANVFGGEMLLAQGGEFRPMRLGLPRALRLAEAAALVDRAVAGRDGWALTLRSDGGAVLVAFHR